MDLLKLSMLMISLSSSGILCINIQSAYDLYDGLLSNYSTDIRPVHNDSEFQNLYVDVYMYNINRLDEVRGELAVVMSLHVHWYDVKLQWNPMDYEGRYKIEVDVTKIWSPSLKLTSPSQKAEQLAKEGDKAVVLYDGLVSSEIIETFYTSCSVQIAYFPFDSQMCDIWFSAPAYGHLLKYIPVSKDINTDIFYVNAVWAVVKTEVKSVSTINEENLVCIIHLQRRAIFTALNLLTPIIILMFLNSMVFILPAESGERVGFSVTLLLAIAVYMTIISEKLPNSSKPAPVLIYVLVAYLAQSACICVKNIFSLKMYFRDDSIPVPKVWFSIQRFVKCHDRKNLQTGNKISCETEGPTTQSEDSQNKTLVDCLVDQRKKITMTWTTVSGTLDAFFLTFNVVLSLFIFITYLCLVMLQPFDVKSDKLFNE